MTSLASSRPLDGNPVLDSDKPVGRNAARRSAIAALARAFPVRTGLLAGLALLAGALPAVFAVLVGRLVDVLPAAVRSGGYGRTLVGLLAGIGAVLLLQELVGAVREWATTDLYRRFDEHLLGRLMATVLAVPGLELFEDPHLSARRDRAVRVARFGPGELVSGLSAQWAARAGGLAATVLVASYQPVAAVVLAALWLVAGRLLRADYFRGNPYWTDPLRRAMYLKRLGLMPEWAKELRIFGLVDWLVDQFGRQWAEVMGELWRARRVGQRTMLLVGLAVVAAHAVTLAFATRAALAGALPIGTLAVVVQGLFGMASLASQHGDVWIENGAVPIPDVLALEREVRAAGAALDVPAGRAAVTDRRHRDRVKLRRAEPSGNAGDGTEPAACPVRDLRFEQIQFAYPGRDRPVFDGLDLTIQAGSSLAIVGLNGAGKTTLIKLLTGLIRPSGGRITVDGKDMSTMDSMAWRRTVAAIFQDFVRYELPARDNIGFGAVETLSGPELDERIWDAAERAGARATLADLPAGLDTVLSRRYPDGVDLSGGQWQRIALARAMLAVTQGARVLVLDEPTAQLDVRAEADLYERFLQLTRGLTTIVISHRFSTVRRADRIVVLESGRIVEDGCHDSLVAAGGRYAVLFRTQAMRYGGGSDG
jgi:ATP-binding cassette, subfamily B, bacterial